MTVFTVATTVVLVLATLITVWFAWQAGSESRKATEAAERTVTALTDLLNVAKATAVSSDEAAQAARQTVEAEREVMATARETVEVTKAAHAADERDRLVRQLRDIGQLVEAALLKATQAAATNRQIAWDCVEQHYLAVALAGIGLKLPKCHSLAGARVSGVALNCAADAKWEVEEELRKLRPA